MNSTDFTQLAQRIASLLFLFVIWLPFAKPVSQLDQELHLTNVPSSHNKGASFGRAQLG